MNNAQKTINTGRSSKNVHYGFADMYLPALVHKSIESEMTRFIVGAASITQIIYMSEVGALILKSNIKLNILELFGIFILRTLISLVVIISVAHLLYQS